MARYHFHIINDIEVEDDEGLELANLAEAHLKAVESARDIGSASVRLGSLNLGHRIEVKNPEGVTLLTVTFADAIHVDHSD